MLRFFSLLGRFLIRLARLLLGCLACTIRRERCGDLRTTESSSSSKGFNSAKRLVTSESCLSAIETFMRVYGMEYGLDIISVYNLANRPTKGFRRGGPQKGASILQKGYPAPGSRKRKGVHARVLRRRTRARTNSAPVYFSRRQHHPAIRPVQASQSGLALSIHLPVRPATPYP